jgi:hypothetical protein
MLSTSTIPAAHVHHPCISCHSDLLVVGRPERAVRRVAVESVEMDEVLGHSRMEESEASGMSNKNARRPKIGLILGGIVVLCGIPNLVLTILPIYSINIVPIYSINYRTTGALMLVTPPVLAAIVVVLALRHMPSARPFLRKFVALLLLTALVLQGLYGCAMMASHGILWKNMTEFFDQQMHGSTPEPFVIAVLSFPAALTVTISGEWMSMVSHVFPVFLLSFLPYGYMIAPYFVLLMLVTPRFLAIPVFWLLVILGLMYVVLPSIAWKWTGDALRRAWSAVWRRKSA